MSTFLLHAPLRKWGVLTILILIFLFTLSVAYADEPVYQHPGVVHGVHLPPIFQQNTEIQAYNDLVEQNAGMTMLFITWNHNFEGYTCGFIDNIYRHRNDGGMPGVNECMRDADPDTPEINTTVMLTWQPMADPATGESFCPAAVNAQGTDWQAISDGVCDDYIDEFATSLKEWNDQYGDRFLIRFAHEMNLHDHLWWQDTEEYPIQFRAAWQHVYNRFRAMGVTRTAAQFVWAPNYLSFPERVWNTLPNFYPGDDYVEWVGLSGYNWDGQHGQDPDWRRFDSLFVDPLPELGMGVLPYLHCHYAKPIVIAEFGTVAGNRPEEDQATWIADAYRRMKDFPYLRAAIYFNDYAYHSVGAPDFRVTEGSAHRGDGIDPMAPGWQLPLTGLTSTYRSALQANSLMDTVPALNNLTPALPYCGTFPPTVSLPTMQYPTQMMVEPGSTASFMLNGVALEGKYDLTLSGLPQGVEGHIIPAHLSPDSPTATVTLSVPADTMVFTVRVNGTGNDVPPLTVAVDVKVTDALYHVYLPTVGGPE